MAVFRRQFSRPLSCCTSAATLCPDTSSYTSCPIVTVTQVPVPPRGKGIWTEAHAAPAFDKAKPAFITNLTWAFSFYPNEMLCYCRIDLFCIFSLILPTAPLIGLLTPVCVWLTMGMPFSSYVEWKFTDFLLNTVNCLNANSLKGVWCESANSC